MSKIVELPKGITIRRGKFHIDITIQGQRYTGTYNDIETAKLQVDEWRRYRDGKTPSKQKLVHLQTEEWTLGKAYEVTKLRRWLGTKAERSSLRNARYVLDFFGVATRLCEVSPTDIDAFVDFLQTQGNSNSTINRKLAALSALFTTALTRGGCTTKPTITKLKEPRGRIRYLSREEESLVLHTLQLWGKLDHHDATVCLVDTGIRTSELWSLTPNNIRIDQGKHGIITLYGDNVKNGESRSIPMTSRVSAILLRRIQNRGMKERLWPSVDNWWYLRVWNRVAAYLGKDDDTQWVPHALRHTCCTRLVQGGMPLPEVAKWMGHRNITTTMRYTHLAPTDLYGGVDILEPKA